MQRIQELVSYINDMCEKPQRSIPDVLAEMVLLCQRRAQLQAEEQEERYAQLQRSYQAEQQRNASLHWDHLSHASSAVGRQEPSLNRLKQHLDLQAAPDV